MGKFEYDSSKNNNKITPQRRYKYPILGLLAIFILLLLMFLFSDNIDIDKGE